ncbi:MAG: multidrug efflux pump-associated protein, AcrZ family [Actinomycetota bacterium]|nr:multidrug efflux pump-associated protein, AcrZ family [Actinomycetota bacterium]
MITAMDIIFAVTLVLVVFSFIAGLVWGLVKTIDNDGLGHRPPPPSHLP